MQTASAYEESNSFEDLTTLFNTKKVYFTGNCLRNIGMNYTIGMNHFTDYFFSLVGHLTYYLCFISMKLI